MLAAYLINSINSTGLRNIACNSNGQKSPVGRLLRVLRLPIRRGATRGTLAIVRL